MLTWCQGVLSRFPDIHVTNLTTSWWDNIIDLLFTDELGDVSGKVLTWCQGVLGIYPDIHVTDLTTSWWDNIIDLLFTDELDDVSGKVLTWCQGVLSRYPRHPRDGSDHVMVG